MMTALMFNELRPWKRCSKTCSESSNKIHYALDKLTDKKKDDTCQLKNIVKGTEDFK